MTSDPPESARSTAPSAYKYSWQFDAAMQKPTMRLHRTHRKLRALLIAMLAVGALFLGVMIVSVVGAVQGWRLGPPWLWSMLFHLFFWPIFILNMWYVRKRFDPVRHIIEERLCLACGYALKGQPLDEEHRGRCPECGRDFSLGEYVHPTQPQRYPLPLEGVGKAGEG